MRWIKAKPIGYENLDFKKKKQSLKQMSSKQAKLLSGFAYSTYQIDVTEQMRNGWD